MRIVIQRVSYAGISIHGEPHNSINKGLLVLVGIEKGDNQEDLNWLSRKLVNLRIFSDQDGKMNQNVTEAGGEIMVVSQFTLFASTQKGSRPSFARSAAPGEAVPLYEAFIAKVSENMNGTCKSGVFGADMQISLVNDGPVTILLDSRNKE